MAQAARRLVLVHVRELHASRAKQCLPRAVVCRTLPGKGVPRLNARPKAHFIRLDADERDRMRVELEAGEGRRIRACASTRRDGDDKAPGAG
jgi:transketolase